jgi:hypothetical protein
MAWSRSAFIGPGDSWRRFNHFGDGMQTRFCYVDDQGEGILGYCIWIMYFRKQ